MNTSVTNNETGVITNFWKQLSTSDDKNKVMKAFFPYILERKPETKEIIFLNKLIKDFDYTIVFDALVALRYSGIELTSYNGYLFSICKNLLKDSSKDNLDVLAAERTEKMLIDLKKRMNK